MIGISLVCFLSVSTAIVTGADTGCFVSDFAACKHDAISDFIQLFDKIVPGEHSRSFQLDLTYAASQYQVAMSTNSPEKQIVAFAIQVCNQDKPFTNKFVDNRVGTYSKAGRRTATCNHQNDTVVQLISTPKQHVTLKLSSLSYPIATFRYYVIDDKLRMYQNEQTVKVPTVMPLSKAPLRHQMFSKQKRNKRQVVGDNSEAHLVIANRRYIHIASLDGSKVQTIVSSGIDNAVSIGFHFRQGYIYWTDNTGTGSRIVRSNLDGSMITPVLEQGLNIPDGLAIDWITNKVYFTDTGLDIIGVFDVSSNWYKTLISTATVSASEPRAIVVDPATRWMYWTDWGSPAKIEKASMDGENRTVLHNTGLGWPNGLTIDYTAQVLYWIDAREDILESSNVDGSNRIIIRSTGISHPFGLTFFSNTLYFTDWSGLLVQAMPTDGSSLTVIFNGTCVLPFAIEAVSEQRQNLVPNPCSDGSCSHLCLLSANDPRGYTCSCPDGLSLELNQQTCNESAVTPMSVDYQPPPQGSCVNAGHLTCCAESESSCQGSPMNCYCDANCHLFGDCCHGVPADCLATEHSPYIVYTSEHFIRYMSLPVNDTDTNVRVKTRLSGFTSATDLDFHYSHGHLYWTDTGGRKIWRSNLDGSGTLLVLDTGTAQPTYLSIDWVSDKLYWVDGALAAINIFDFISGHQATLLTMESQSEITDLAVHPHRRELYWTLAGPSPRIEKSSLDGSNQATLHATNLGRPTTLYIDFSESNGLYWADTQMDTLEFSTLDGGFRQTILNSTILPPLSIAINSHGNLYYVGFFAGVVSVGPAASNSRILNQGGCTIGNGVQVISNSRQQPGANPCGSNNGGCSNSDICLPRTSSGTLCISAHNITAPPVHGTCAAAGISGCCNSGQCNGFPPTCSCSSSCRLFQACCSDYNCNMLNECLNQPCLNEGSCIDEDIGYRCECPTGFEGTNCENEVTFDFVTRPSDVSVNEFEEVQFHCIVTSVFTPMITWSFIRQGTDQLVHIADITGAVSSRYSVSYIDKSSTLTILSTQFPDDDGEYTCTASEMESIFASASLDIVFPPSLEVTGVISAMELEEIVLECTVLANPQPDITWLKTSTNEVARILRSLRISFNRIDQFGSSVSTLRISRANTADSGVYVCQASNGLSTLPITREWTVNVTGINECLGQPCQNEGLCKDQVDGYVCECTANFEGAACEKEVTVTTLMAPQIVQSPSGESPAISSSINLTCMATGSPAPSYTWYKDGVLIRGETQSRLHISEAQPKDRGSYVCKAVNSQGESLSEPASINIPGVLQYSMSIQLSSNSTVNLREVVHALVSRKLSETNSSVFSVNVPNTTTGQEMFEATLSITLLVQNSRDMLTAEDLRDIRTALYSELQQTPTVTSVENIRRYDGCESEDYLGYTWPETSLGMVGRSSCPCEEFLGGFAGEVIRFCSGTFSQGAMWSSDIDFSKCETFNSEISQRLCDAAMGVLNETVQVSKDILMITTDSQNLTAPQVSVASSVVELLTEEATNNPEVRGNYLQTIDNIQQADADVIFMSQVERNSSSRILDSLESFLDNLDVSTLTQNSSNNQTVFIFNTFGVQVQEVDPNNFRGQTFIIDLGSVEKARNISEEIDVGSLMTIDATVDTGDEKVTPDDLKDSTASVQLPTDLLKNCTDANNVTSIVSQRLSYSVFIRDVLFQPENRSEYRVGSIVVAARIRCLLSDDNTLSMPIRTRFRTVDTDQLDENVSMCAVYGSGRFGAWDTSGCELVQKADGTTECDCVQQGHFGILFDLNPRITSLPIFGLALNVITYIGLALSLISLSVFIITYLSSRKLRSSVHGQILVNMSVSLMGLYVTFLIGGFTTKVPVLCGIVSALLQYFFLVFFSWTAVESIWLYLKLVKVLGSPSFTSKYMLKAGLPAWLLPILIVVLSAGPGHQYYVSKHFCRATEWPFYFGSILPFLALYVLNWILFVMIMVSICKHTKNLNKLKEKSRAEQARDIRNNFIIAVSLAIVQGLGWGFGLLATSSPLEEVTITLQVFFSIFVGIQGVLIFFLHGVRNSDARDSWKKCLAVVIRKTHPKYLVSGDKTSTMGPTGRSGAGTDSIGLSTLPCNKKLDLSKEKEAESYTNAYTSEASIEQGPTESEMSPDGVDVPGVNPPDLKCNETWQNRSHITAVNPNPLHEEPNTSGRNSPITWVKNETKWVKIPVGVEEQNI